MIINPFASVRPNGQLLIAAIGQPSTNPPLQVIDTDEVLAVALVIRRNSEKAAVRRECRVLVTNLGKLALFFAARVVPHEPRWRIGGRLKNENSIQRDREPGHEGGRVLFQFLL